MQTLKYVTQVDTRGRIVLREVPLKHGVEVEVTVLSREEPASEDLSRAAETSLSFWDNPIDDEVWNDA
ncbi:MAG: DUF2281 domain-containing protein [Acidobacteria bacterium]|nr:DUF2281 domain-containing protein [Acidobacteriota bacterium]